jgi:predicted CopG family antitoxin
LAKTITIRDEVYERLLKMKRSEESFSDLFERLADTLDPLETLKRLRGSVEFRDKETMLEELSEARAEGRP